MAKIISLFQNSKDEEIYKRTCEICDRYYEDNFLDYASLYVFVNGEAVKRIDMCPDCLSNILKYAKENKKETQIIEIERSNKNGRDLV